MTAQKCPTTWMPTMRAERIEQDSSTWLAVHEWASEQLETCRKKNDAQALDSVATAHLRGRIATLKAILALPQAAPTSPGDE